MKKDQNRIFSPAVLLPQAVFLLAAAAFLVLALGRNEKMAAAEVKLLEPAAGSVFCGSGRSAEVQLCYDGSSERSVMLLENAAGVLDRLQEEYTCVDLAEEQADLEACRTLWLCTGQLSLFGDLFPDFALWLERNDFIWLCMPEYSEEFQLISRLLGVVNCSGQYVDGVNGLAFEDAFLPGLSGVSFPEIELLDTGLSLELEASCRVHLRDTENGLPLIWTRTGKNGNRAVIFNNNLMFERNNYTGMIAAAAAETEEVLAWPVINAMAAFIDDFPAPQPEGTDERLMEQFGYNTQSFYRNVWWPDMKEIAEKYGLRYTGVLIEDYNDTTEPPFAAGTADSLLQYYGAELLDSGGEIALHGYNHMPLIPEGYQTEDNYAGWPSEENMALSLTEFQRYAKQLFPEVTFTSYVPPSNDLSPEGYEVLKASVESLSVVSGVYYDYEGGTSYMTDFTEEEDGILQFPRISAGFASAGDDIVRIYCMLYSQGVFSHFIHPDDVLDEERGAELGWTVMLSSFDSMFEGVTAQYPMLRGLTAASAGGALQRALRLRVQTETDETGVTLKLENRADEAWIALSLRDRKPGSVTGAELYPVSEQLVWLCCTEDTVRVSWAEAQ